MVRFHIRTSWTNSVSVTHEFTLDNLADGAARDRLKWAMSDPERLRPGETRQTVTERVAATFAVLALYNARPQWLSDAHAPVVPPSQRPTGGMRGFPKMKHLLYWILAAISLSGCSSVAKTPSDFSASESDRTVSAGAGFGEFDRVNWTVTCGLPTRDNPLIDLLSTQFELGPFARNAGHMLAKKLSRPHPEGGLSTEMWVLSPALGEWWRLKAIRVHPEDLPKLTSNAVEDIDYRDVRQIVASPFLPEPVVVRGGDDEAVVDVQILARLPEVSRLRCRL